MLLTVTSAQVRSISLGSGKPAICDLVAKTISTIGDQYQLDTPMRVKHFLGQTCIESAFFSRLEEGLYYHAERLVEVWPNRFPNLKAAGPYAENPQALANKTYGGRMGNIGANDGWLYRGSGIPQMTGKNNFDEFNHWIHQLFPSAPDFITNPDAARTLDWAVWPALWYWTVKNCADYADRDDSKGLTRAINGGTEGQDDRIKATALAAKVLNMSTNPAPVAVPPKIPDPLLKQYQAKMVQLSTIMKRKDFNPGTPDGWNGNNTVTAVKALQKFVNLNADGKLGPNTRSAIDLLCLKYSVNV